MKNVYLAGAFMLSLVLALPAQAQKKNKPGKKPTQTLEAEKVFRPGAVAGKLTYLSGNTFTLRVTYASLEWKPNARQILNNINRQNQGLVGQLNRLGQLQNQLAGARSGRQRNNIMNQINRLSGQIQRTAGRNQQLPYRLAQKTADVEIEMSPDVKIRTNFLPFAYDDMGNPKKYTKEELKELKGPNSKEPGYKAELDALKTGQDIKVTLTRVKEKDPDSPSDDKKDKPAEKKDAADAKKADAKDPADTKKPDAKDPANKTTKEKPKYRLLATKVLILKETDEAPSPGQKPNRRKKKQ